ncbi:MAG: type I restriction enzyme HsdR N-terminal domain-containing protein [Parachlamydiales bacterium]|nr:type I restriction enzyme HsdR N-terminal domain-containing protein [Parachlamydiales bacterium]
MINQIGRCFDPIRKVWVKATPEEIVRQRLINMMINQLGFPPSLLSVETDISLLPHLITLSSPFPKRRLDLICYGKNIHPQYDLYPLLMVECKATCIKEIAVRQVIGYNHFVKAYYIALVGNKEIRLGWYDDQKGDYTFIDHIPSFEDLCSVLKGFL